NSPHFGPKCGRTNFEGSDPWKGQQVAQGGKVGHGVKVVLGVKIGLGVKVGLLVVAGFSFSWVCSACSHNHHQCFLCVHGCIVEAVSG
ncbi:hypothetical protein A2U01_0081834, partial [Trifolium medium]|nr:hypothetical protein [Trifolium medium]